MTKVLIDGDILIYQIAAVAEENVEFSNEVVAAWVDINAAKQAADAAIHKIIDNTKSDDAVICLTDTTNWRKSLLDSYKANRRGIRKPVALAPLRQYLEKTRQCEIWHTLEADDVLGILLTEPVGERRIMYSKDKDLLQIPGLHWDHKLHKIVTITEADGDRQHWLQMLTGDTTDNYFGVPGIGPKRAARILEKAGDTPWRAVVSAYENKGLSSTDALIQAQVSRICRYSDFDHENREVKLWMPPQLCMPN
jgi:DNA polymerase-1